ncbi:Single-stranded-DNA-specific exonuclease RecJ [Liberibacter crescens BT-1]|uniref:Single-stranded-DNA-specific exonuclease RecJ n=1 Tax=Liberibacter crescens (strain BT-1) TaxID=1215343 RepID=L0EU01_LIBCB|nr:single-stranded-DNA-specific exonuclease RecJ [Liberibacter crescens]AGA64437.1 Single-stranded-DNA-specific exonuclease RecJ [Liberibacter crescens BT-1]AMC12616.1 single-stranded DNA exonuclease [Liberibacter crescens]
MKEFANSQAFLDVEHSVSGFRWVSLLDQAGVNHALAIAQIHGISDLVARILAGRGVGIEKAMDFLNPTLRSLMPNPDTLVDCDKAARRIIQAIYQVENIAILGDYDVDGAASVALIARFLNHFGIKTRIYIPDRILEGYGPNPVIIKKLIDEGAQLIIAVDCGSTSHESLEIAASRNVDVIVIDHHQVGTEIPCAYALVNPNRQDDLSLQDHLCAAGVVFLVLVLITRILRAEYNIQIKDLDLLSFLDIVALATVCDAVPLTGLNRAYVRKGIIVARHKGNPGIKALMELMRRPMPITYDHFGFMIGPRINAGGRIGDSNLGSRLLISDNLSEIETIAAQLDSLNRDRQFMEATMLQQAEAEVIIKYGDTKGALVIVATGESWHPGIVGLLATRLKDKFGCPAFAIAFDNTTGKGIGSGRSVIGFDIGIMVRAALEEGLLLKGGGHAMAAGLTVEHSNIDRLRIFFEEYVHNAGINLAAIKLLKIDGALSAAGATVELFDMLECVGPYGSCNPKPLFVFPRHKLCNFYPIGSSHLKVIFENQDSLSIEGIAFYVIDTPLGNFLMKSRGKWMHIAGYLSMDYWKGRKQVQLHIKDAAACI